VGLGLGSLGTSWEDGEWGLHGNAKIKRLPPPSKQQRNGAWKVETKCAFPSIPFIMDSPQVQPHKLHPCSPFIRVAERKRRKNQMLNLGFKGKN